MERLSFTFDPGIAVSKTHDHHKIEEYARIKRERKTFHTRIEDIYDEFKFTYSKGLLAGLVLSIVSFGLGLYLPMGMLVLIAAVSVAAALTFRQSLLSAAYTLGVSIVDDAHAKRICR